MRENKRARAMEDLSLNAVAHGNNASAVGLFLELRSQTLYPFSAAVDGDHSITVAFTLAGLAPGT
jgi:hypothetical protein